MYYIILTFCSKIQSVLIYLKEQNYNDQEVDFRGKSGADIPGAKIRIVQGVKG